MCDCARANDVTESTNYKPLFLNRKLITESILRYFCHKSTFDDKLMFVVKQVPVCNFILLIFACIVLRKVHVHSLFTLETVGFPECLLFLDSDPVAWPTGVQLLVFFCSSVPVVLFDTPGISMCRSQHVSVESSSLLHHSIYL